MCVCVCVCVCVGDIQYVQCICIETKNLGESQSVGIYMSKGMRGFSGVDFRGHFTDASLPAWIHSYGVLSASQCHLQYLARSKM